MFANLPRFIGKLGLRQAQTRFLAASRTQLGFLRTTRIAYSFILKMKRIINRLLLIFINSLFFLPNFILKSLCRPLFIYLLSALYYSYFLNEFPGFNSNPF